jgi:hypothetical protein
MKGGKTKKEYYGECFSQELIIKGGKMNKILQK